MHEFGITSRIMKAVLRVAEENDAKRVVRVDLKIGRLTFLDIRQVKMCYDILAKGTILEGSELCVEESAGIVLCPTCNLQREVQFHFHDDQKISLEKIPVLSCPDCGGKVVIIKGKECQVNGIALEN